MSLRCSQLLIMQLLLSVKLTFMLKIGNTVIIHVSSLHALQASDDRIIGLQCVRVAYDDRL